MRSIVALSGGLDSATLLAKVLSEGKDAICVSFFYSSKHNEYENEASLRLAVHYQVPFHFVDLSGTMAGFKSNLLKTGGPIPEGHYQEESMALTVVPARNLIFASVLAGLAVSLDAEEIYLGIQTDAGRSIYPDCRPIFVHAIAMAIYHATDSKVQLKTPFLNDNKTEVVKLGASLDVPFHLTRTCYQDQPVACGKCGACVKRREAFANSGLIDPVPYV